MPTTSMPGNHDDNDDDDFPALDPRRGSDTALVVGKKVQAPSAEKDLAHVG